MLGSDYRELIVPRTDNTAQKIAVTAGGIAAAVILLVIALVSRSFLLMLLGVSAGIAVWPLSMSTRIEYEYIISGDQLTVTKIIAQSRRKQMLTVLLSQFTAFGQLRDAEPQPNGQTTVRACTAMDQTAFYADFDHESLGQTRLIWTPNDDILLYLTKKMPRSLGFRWEAEQQK